MLLKDMQDTYDLQDALVAEITERLRKKNIHSTSADAPNSIEFIWRFETKKAQADIRAEMNIQPRNQPMEKDKLKVGVFIEGDPDPEETDTDRMLGTLHDRISSFDLSSETVGDVADYVAAAIIDAVTER